MRTTAALVCTMFLSTMLLAEASGREANVPNKAPLEAVVEDMELTDVILRDGVAELSSKNIAGLHLGMEEIIRDRIQDDARTQGPHFSLHIKSKTVRQILDDLCRSDPRYTWSEDASTINIYPRAAIRDSSYLLNLRIDKIALTAVPDPDQALNPLSKVFPTQQIGYAGVGLGGDAYAEPWTATFERLTARQFINRLAEHLGPHTVWVWQGGKDERLFTFAKNGFHTSRPAH